MTLPGFVRGTADEQGYARRLRDRLVAEVWGDSSRLPQPVWLVLRGLTDPHWWIVHERQLVEALAERLGPHVELLVGRLPEDRRPAVAYAADRSASASARRPSARRALCLGVGSFGAQSCAEDAEADLSAWDALPYAESRTRELHQALQAAGYESAAPDAATLRASALGEEVTTLLADAEVDVVIVHVLSHGDHRRRGGVYVVGADGEWSAQTRVEDWVVRVSDNPSAPYTLFLIDLCHAGAATRLQWQPPAEPGENERAWVIAATGAADPAYAGRLTRAAATVIRRIGSGEIDLSPTLPTVPFAILFDWIAKELRALTAQEGGYQQEPTATPTVGTAHVPFFPNPGYRPDELREAAVAVGPAVAPFVDPVLDAEHFRDRARGRAGGDTAAGCFAGRAPQLRRLATWMDDADPADTGLMVVTGSPGAGKSALLGLLVCAAHPALRGPTHALWRHSAAHPSLNPNLVAIHARQRAIGDIVTSLAIQLGIDLDEYGEITPDTLLVEVVELGRRPLIVIDAVDEAVQPHELLDRLVTPLTRARRADGTLACQLLVGVRPWPEFASLTGAAASAGGLIDLDAIPAAQRRDDVAEYVASLLELEPEYADIVQKPGRSAFATALADTLVSSPGSTEHDGNDQRWGEFLVAALYTHWVVRHARPTLADPRYAATLGADAPLTLPAVLTLDLAARPDTPWFEPVLHAIAHGFGAGMPLTVIQALAPVFADSPQDTPTREVLVAALDAARFYLRTSTDTDGTTLYRLFHHGLTNTLMSATWEPPRAGSRRPIGDPVFDRLLAAVPAPAGQRRWDLAEPYVVRHAIQHAARVNRVEELLVDPEFLVYAAPGAIIAALDDAHTDAAVLAARVYASSAGRLYHLAPDGRRQVLAVDAARYGTQNLLNAFTRRSGQPVMAWRPAWATGGHVNPALRATILGETGMITAAACIAVDGQPAVVTGGWHGEVRIWDLTTRQQVGESLTGHTQMVTSLACASTDWGPVAVSGDESGVVRVWDLRTREQLGDALAEHTDSITAVACTTVNGHLVAVLGDANGGVQVWNLTTRRRIGDPLVWESAPVESVEDIWTFTAMAVRRQEKVESVECVQVGAHLHIVASGWRDGAIRIWDLATGERIGTLSLTEGGYLAAVACTDLDGRPVAVTGGWDGIIRLWDLTTRQQLGSPLTRSAGSVSSLTCVRGDGHAIAVGFGSSMWVWDLIGQRQVGDPITAHTDSMVAVAGAHLNGRPVAVSVSRDVVDVGDWGDGTIRIWDLDGQRKVGNPRAGHTGEVRSVACAYRDKRSIAVTAGQDDTVRLWDLTNGQSLGKLPEQHTRSVEAVRCTYLNGRPVVVTASMGDQGTIRVWDLKTRRQISKVRTGRASTMAALACLVVKGRLIAITGGGDLDDRETSVWAWDVTRGRQIGHRLTGHTADYIEDVAGTFVDGRPVALSAGVDDHTVRLWDLVTMRQIGDPLTGHGGHANSVACVELDGRPIAVTGGDDPALLVWDLSTRQRIGGPLTGTLDYVDGVTCTHMDGRPIAVARSWRDAAIAVWDLTTFTELAAIRLPSPVEAVAATGDAIVAAMGQDIVALHRTPEGTSWAPAS